MHKDLKRVAPVYEAIDNYPQLRWLYNVYPGNVKAEWEEMKRRFLFYKIIFGGISTGLIFTAAVFFWKLCMLKNKALVLEEFSYFSGCALYCILTASFIIYWKDLVEISANSDYAWPSKDFAIEVMSVARRVADRHMAFSDLHLVLGTQFGDKDSSSPPAHVITACKKSLNAEADVWAKIGRVNPTSELAREQRIVSEFEKLQRFKVLPNEAKVKRIFQAARDRHGSFKTKIH